MNRREFVVGAASALVVHQLPAGAASAVVPAQYEAIVRSQMMPVMLPGGGVVWVPIRPPGIL